MALNCLPCKIRSCVVPSQSQEKGRIICWGGWSISEVNKNRHNDFIQSGGDKSHVSKKKTVTRNKKIEKTKNCKLFLGAFYQQPRRINHNSYMTTSKTYLLKYPCKSAYIKSNLKKINLLFFHSLWFVQYFSIVSLCWKMTTDLKGFAMNSCSWQSRDCFQF